MTGIPGENVQPSQTIPHLTIHISRDNRGVSRLYTTPNVPRSGTVPDAGTAESGDDLVRLADALDHHEQELTQHQVHPGPVPLRGVRCGDNSVSRETTQSARRQLGQHGDKEKTTDSQQGTTATVGQ